MLGIVGCFFFFPPGAGIEFKASHMPDKCTATKLGNISPAAFYLYFEEGSYRLPKQAWSLLICFCCTWMFSSLSFPSSWDCRPVSAAPYSIAIPKPSISCNGILQKFVLMEFFGFLRARALSVEVWMPWNSLGRRQWMS